MLEQLYVPDLTEASSRWRPDTLKLYASGFLLSGAMGKARRRGSEGDCILQILKGQIVAHVNQ